MSEEINKGSSSRFALPNGVYHGDMFFVTDANNRILIAFAWTGVEWIHERQVFLVENIQHTTEGCAL